MLIIPAIDLLDGKAVRLYQGSYDKVSTYDNDPVAAARRLQPQDGGLALRLFRSNRDAGLILFASLVGGGWNG